MSISALSMLPSLSTAAHNYGLSSRQHVSSSATEYTSLPACEQSTALTASRYLLQHFIAPVPGLGDYSAGAFDVFVRTLDCVGKRKLSRPLTVYVELDGDSFIARTREFEQVYGVGDSISNSLEDFELCLLDLFEDLSDMRAPYSTEWEQVRTHLSELMGK